MGVVVMGAMAQQTYISPNVLRGLFGLTAAEADLAARIAGRERLSTIAAERGRSTNTVRARLKAVMAKTGSGRQAELAQLLECLSQLRDEF